MTTSLLTLSHLSKSYPAPGGAQSVLDDISLEVAPASTLALRGESGSGKSTLLHLIAGLDRPDTGEIQIAGHALGQMRPAERARLRREDVALIFQQFNLIPSLTVRQNLGFHARLAGRFDAAAVEALAGRLGLSALMERMPDQISGGQRQRVAIGRAVALRPKLLLADEPTGNLDEETAESVIAELRALVADIGSTLLVATHSDRLAGMLDRRVTLRRGRLVAQ